MCAQQTAGRACWEEGLPEHDCEVGMGTQLFSSQSPLLSICISRKLSFVQQVFTEHFYVPGSVLEAGKQQPMMGRLCSLAA